MQSFTHANAKQHFIKHAHAIRQLAEAGEVVTRVSRGCKAPMVRSKSWGDGEDTQVARRRQDPPPDGPSNPSGGS